MKLAYFASIRERIGLAEEDVSVPAGIGTVADLIGWLESRGENYAQALKTPQLVRVALDHEHARHDASLASVREVAFFPPMTGG
ncbi:molybdopterin converting factor subunit 1 [Aureimonas altamirensis]|jgi:sulfur-carrier protein|uniref:molybdopterin converting factor subunit 1 n=1 Tax=Aureimonas altamirensis TaxID=370622 RepID=UPI001E32FBD2|nr:molybdopterin converting factor subunit 1 [Aureimonas altamirensis]UHD44432.1 molybdopterin converting factor subunit 1 [Aureimonas altamirensis]